MLLCGGCDALKGRDHDKRKISMIYTRYKSLDVLLLSRHVDERDDFAAALHNLRDCQFTQPARVCDSSFCVEAEYLVRYRTCAAVDDLVLVPENVVACQPLAVVLLSAY